VEKFYLEESHKKDQDNILNITQGYLMSKVDNQNGSVVIFMFIVGLIVGFMMSVLAPFVYNDIMGTDSLEVTIFKDFQAQDYKDIPLYFEEDYNNWKFREKKDKFMKSRNEDK
jgi:hypothetical protein